MVFAVLYRRMLRQSSQVLLAEQTRQASPPQASVTITQEPARPAGRCLTTRLNKGMRPSTPHMSFSPNKVWNPNHLAAINSHTIKTILCKYALARISFLIKIFVFSRNSTFRSSTPPGQGCLPRHPEGLCCCSKLEATCCSHTPCLPAHPPWV